MMIVMVLTFFYIPYCVIKTSQHHITFLFSKGDFDDDYGAKSFLSSLGKGKSSSGGKKMASMADKKTQEKSSVAAKKKDDDDEFSFDTKEAGPISFCVK
jgi:hypothetical protein